MRPPYITATWCATSATTPRSCVIRITAAPVSAWRFASTASTCACTVTSSAVVGSSAMISRGRPDIAIAITARWRMPPENWCGYWLARFCGSGMSTSRSSSTARCAAWPGATCPCATCPSITCRPIGNTGLSVVVGSWNTMPTSRPRILRSDSASSVVTSTPSSWIEPCTCAVGGSRPLIASEVTLLPEPDSPTMPSTWLASTSKSMPRTAGTARPDPTNVTVSPRTRSVNGTLWCGRSACCRSRARCRRHSWPPRSGRCRRCWSGSRTPPRPAPCSGCRRPP